MYRSRFLGQKKLKKSTVIFGRIKKVCIFALPKEKGVLGEERGGVLEVVLKVVIEG